MSDPQILSAVYDGGQVSVQWTAPTFGGEVSKYVVGLASSNGGPAYQASFDPPLLSGVVAVQGGFQAGYLYTCTVMAMMVKGATQQSNTLPVITTIPTLHRVTYDGTKIAARWSMPAESSALVLSYTLQAIPVAGDKAFDVNVEGGASTEGAIQLASALSPGDAWQFVLSANAAGGARAVTNKYKLITQLPAWEKALYRGTSMGAAWTIAPVTPAGTVDGFAVEIAPEKDGPTYCASFSNPNARSGSVAIPVPLLAWRNYGARVMAYSSNGIVNSATTLLAMVVDRPQVCTVAGSLTAVTASWQQVQQFDADIVSYMLVATSTGEGQVYQLEVPNPEETSATMPFAPPLPAMPSYALEVRATTSGGVYESVSDSVPILTSVPTGLTSSYDGAVARCQWTAVTDATGYTVSVLDAALVIAEAEVNLPEAAIAVALCHDRPYTIQAKVGTKGVTGAAISATLLTAIPAIAHTEYDPALGTSIRWNPLAPSTGATGYVLQILADKQPFGAPVCVAGVASENATIGGVLDTVHHFSVALRATADGASAHCGEAAPILSGRPELTSVNYDDHALHLAWITAEDERVTGYQVCLTANGTSSNYTSAFPEISIPGALQGTVQINVRALSGNSCGYASESLTAIVVSPVLSGAAYVDGILTITWNPAGESDSIVTVFDGSAEVARQQTSGSSAAMAIRLDPSRNYTVAVQSAAGCVVGPPSNLLQLIAAAPQVIAVAFDTCTAVCTVSWQAVSTATGYGIRVFEGDRILVDTAVSGGQSSSYAVQAELHSEMRHAVQVRTITNDVLGPWSIPAPLLAASPQNVVVHYDGAYAEIEWEAFAGATGYRAAILSGNSEATHCVTTGTSACIALSDDPGQTFKAMVAVLDGSSLGKPSVATPLFTPGFFPSTSSQSAPYLLPAVTASRAAYDIVLSLPNLFTVAPQPLPSTPPFVLAATATGPFSYTLTIAKDSMAWTGFGGSPIRASLRAAYAAFLAALEALGATSLGIATVQEAISRAMPQTFAETLFYGYAFDAANGYADLRPGTGLRVEFESYQYMGAVTDANFRNGFTLSGIADYNIGTYTRAGQWLIGLDSFIDSIVATGGVVVHTPSHDSGRVQGGGGVVDTAYPQFMQPFLRLIYPPMFQTQDSLGSPYPQSNAALLAAPTYGALETATSNLRHGNQPGTNVAILYFRGRAVPRPTIRVTIDGAARTMILGATLGDLLGSNANRPPLMNLSYRNIALYRSRSCAIEAGELDAVAGYSVGAAWPVRIDWHPGSAYNAVMDRFDLPLMHGDRVVTGR